MSMDRILVARIGAAHGIRGEVRVKSFTADPLALGDYGPLSNGDGSIRLNVDRLRDAGNMLVVAFAEVRDRTEAETLNGVDLYVDRSSLPDDGDEDDFYHADLIGLAVETTGGDAIGKVLAVQDFGAGDLLEVERGGKTTLFVPFTKAVVPVVDVKGGRIVVSPPDGLLDDPQAEPKPKRVRRPPRSNRAEGETGADGTGTGGADA